MKGRHYAIYEDCNKHDFVANKDIGPIIAALSKESGCGVTRVYAGADATALVHKCGLHTQQEVINLHAQGVPGYGPANPVDRSTHCDYNDGIAYRFWRAGKALPWWAEGFDLQIAKIAAFIAAARRRHDLVTQTYPGAQSEAQHCNFRRLPKSILNPLRIWIKRPLKHGSTGTRVRFITRMLARIPDKQGHMYLSRSSNRMTSEVVAAVEKFQRQHHQKVDGKVGIATRHQIVASAAYHKRKK